MIFIKNAHIKTMAGADLENGCILIENGKITALDTDLNAPEGAQVIAALGRF